MSEPHTIDDLKACIQAGDMTVAGSAFDDDLVIKRCNTCGRIWTEWNANDPHPRADRSPPHDSIAIRNAETMDPDTGRRVVVPIADVAALNDELRRRLDG